MDTYTINKKLDELYAELDMISTMPSMQVCKKCNVDYKSEALENIQSEIDSLNNELKEITDEEDEYGMWDANGFANERDYTRWRYGA